jgi:hypothetical protein
LAASLCRFVAYHDEKFYVSDIGNNCYFVVDVVIK